MVQRYDVPHDTIYSNPTGKLVLFTDHEAEVREAFEWAWNAVQWADRDRIDEAFAAFQSRREKEGQK